MVAIGFDSHKGSLAAAAVDGLGRRLADEEFSNDPTGHRRAHEWMKRFDSRVVGIEGTGTYGAALAWFLLDQGEVVREVPATLTFRERNRKPSNGKSDPVDALAIARVAAREPDLPVPKRAGIMVDLKLLCDHREQLIRERTRLVNRAHRDLVVLHPGYHRTVKSLRSKKNVRAAMALLEDDSCIRSELTARRLGQILKLDEEISEASRRIASKLEESRTSLRDVPGIGDFVAATILGEVGDVSRIRSKAAFASLGGSAPLKASSGKTSRHRMNHGGNRALHRALRVVARAQARTLPEAKAFVERKLSEGKSYREAIRALQRHLANVVYRTLVEDARKASLSS